MTVGKVDRPGSLAVTTAEPSPTEAATLGMTRRTAVPDGKFSEMLAIETPAATLTSALSVPSKAGATSLKICATSQGLTAATTRSLHSTSSRFEEVVRTP
jgi:hypothetical protein